MTIMRKPLKPKHLSRPKGVAVPKPPVKQDSKPRCRGCGEEFKLLTALGLKKVDMYCFNCEYIRRKLAKQVKEWQLNEKRDLRIKGHIMPVKGYSWMEQKKAC